MIFGRNRKKETSGKKDCKSKKIFAKKARAATEADKQIVTDLMDTLRANREICVGMAANMIGENKAISRE